MKFRNFILLTLFTLLLSQFGTHSFVKGLNVTITRVDKIEIVIDSIGIPGFEFDGYYYQGINYFLKALLKNKDGYILSSDGYDFDWRIIPKSIGYLTPTSDLCHLFIQKDGIGQILLLVKKDGLSIGYALLPIFALPHRHLFVGTKYYDEECNNKCSPYPCRIVFEFNPDLDNELVDKNYCGCYKINRLSAGPYTVHYNAYDTTTNDTPGFKDDGFCDNCCRLTIDQAKDRILVKSSDNEIIKIGNYSRESALESSIIPLSLGSNNGHCTIKIHDPSNPLIDPRSYLCVYVYPGDKRIIPSSKEFSVSIDRRDVPKGPKFPYPMEYTLYEGIYPSRDSIDFEFNADIDDYYVQTNKPWLRTSSEIALFEGNNEYSFKILVYPYYLISGVHNIESEYQGLITVTSSSGNYNPFYIVVNVKTQNSIELMIDKQNNTVHRIWQNGMIENIGEAKEGDDYIFHNNRHYINIDNVQEWLGLRVEKKGKTVEIHRYGKHVRFTKDNNTMEIKKLSLVGSLPPAQNPIGKNYYHKPNIWIIDKMFNNEEYSITSKKYPDKYFVMLRAALICFGTEYEYDSNIPNELRIIMTPEKYFHY